MKGLVLHDTQISGCMTFSFCCWCPRTRPQRGSTEATVACSTYSYLRVNKLTLQVKGFLRFAFITAADSPELLCNLTELQLSILKWAFGKEITSFILSLRRFRKLRVTLNPLSEVEIIVQSMLWKNERMWMASEALWLAWLLQLSIHSWKALTLLF